MFYGGTRFAGHALCSMGAPASRVMLYVLCSMLFVAVSQRSYWGAILFMAVLLVFGVALLWGVRWWRQRVRLDTSDETRTIARNTSIPFLLQILTRAIDIGFAMVLYRFVVQEDVGSFDFAALLVVQYLGTFADWGLTTLATRDISVNKDHTPTLFRTTLRLRLRLALLAVPLAALLVFGYQGLARAQLIPAPLPAQTIWIIGLLVGTLFPAALSGTATALLQAYERHEIAALINLFTNVVSAFLRTALLIAGLGIVGVAAGALVAALGAAGVFWIILQRTLGPLPLRGPVGAFKPLLIEGWPLLLNALLIGVFFRFDVILLQAFQGAAAVATYTVAYRYINLTQIIPPVVVNAIFPMLSRRAVNDQEGVARAYAGTLRMLLLVAFPLAMGITMLAQPLIVLLADAAYLPASAYALMLTIWYLPGSYINGLTQYVIIALGQQRAITRAFAFTAAFNFSLNLIFIPVWGFFAAAVITILSEIVLFVPLHRVLRNANIRVAWGPLLMRPAVAALAMGGAMWLALQLHLLLAVLVALPVYATVLWLLGTFTPADRVLLARVLGR